MLKIKLGESKAKEEKKSKNASKTVQELLGIKGIEGNTVKVINDAAPMAIDEEKYYIRINPQNINILLDTMVLAIINNFKKVINITEKLEILIVDKTEKVDDNKNYLRDLIDRKENPVYKELLQMDLDNMNKEFSKSASREFYIVIPYKGEKEKEAISQIESIIRNQDFDVNPCSKNDIKNMLQVYVERNFTNGLVKDYDI